MSNINPGVYQHYKGNFYLVIGLARHSETHDAFVTYQALYGDYGLWVRPLEMFTSTVTIDGKEIPRFKFITQGRSQLPTVR